MKTHALTLTNTRSVTNMALLSLLVLAAVSTSADAKHCGMGAMPHVYGGMHPHGPMPYAKQHKMPYGKKYGVHMMAGRSVIAVAKQTGKFGTLLTAIEAAGLTGLLEGKGPFTLFAPTDTAFEKLPAGTLQELLADKTKLITLLKYHVVPNRVTALQVLESRELNTASGQKLPTSDLSVIRADIMARNGTIHVIDRVLQPSN